MFRHHGRILPAASAPLPSASGFECVRVLVTLGWMPQSWTEHECRLERGGVAIPVPLEPNLPSSTVAEIVRASGEMPGLFADTLANLRKNRSTA